MGIEIYLISFYRQGPDYNINPTYPYLYGPNL